jgi:hypothetical protein
LYHIIAGDSPGLHLSNPEKVKHSARDVSEMTTHTLNCLRSLDCCIAKELKHKLAKCAESLYHQSTVEACCGVGDGSQLNLLRAARSAVIIRLTAGAPSLMASYLSHDAGSVV